MTVGREELDLIEKLRKIEALFARAGTDGERAAAGSALDRIRARLRELEKVERPIEYKFTLADTWSRSLFVALLRRYGLEPYRFRGQRATTVMVKVTPSFAKDTLWPEFQQLDATLRKHLSDVTERVIAQAIFAGATGAEERAGKEKRAAH